MAFTGKATYSAGTSLPELVEDVADIVGIISPFETPLLDALGDPLYSARSTYHEWLEDCLLPNKDAINDSVFTDPDVDTSFVVDNASRFQVGDQIQVESSDELMLVTAIDTGTNTLTVVRGYAGTTAEDLADNQVLNILGNAALEGTEKLTARFTNRTRQGNYTQILTSTVEVSGSDLASRQLALADEMDMQKQLRLRELLRDLENTVINGGQANSNPEGSSAVRRTLKGILQTLTTNAFVPGQGDFPSGTGLDEDKINHALRMIWENSSGNIDLMVMNGFQKRQLNSLLDGSRSYGPDDVKFRNMISYYEGDFGLCRVVVSRWMPQDAILFLDSSRFSVLPLAGRSFHFKPLASTGDYECGQLIGEYTLELRNESAHGSIRGLSTS